MLTFQSKFVERNLEGTTIEEGIRVITGIIYGVRCSLGGRRRR